MCVVEAKGLCSDCSNSCKFVFCECLPPAAGRGGALSSSSGLSTSEEARLQLTLRVHAPHYCVLLGPKVP